LLAVVAAQGITVIPFVAGAVREVVQAWLTGRIGDACFAMPGCRGTRRPATQRVKKSRNGGVMPGAMGQGSGQGSGQGKGRGAGGKGAGRLGGGAMAGPEGLCVCPKCGQEEKHQRGTPCMQRQCPKCGTAMIRK
jgi:ssDNA-binding Zn-finger/Zn-ribbon topoisomerase 1